jgi:serine/threonine protein phosphatase 1
MRTFVIGDIHGEIDKLKKLIEKLHVFPQDKLIFVGDYIDRGRYTKEVIDYLLELSSIHTCVFLKGNHEDMMLDACIPDYQPSYPHRSPSELWKMNGGKQTMESYGLYDYNTCEKFWDKMPEKHKQFFLNLEMFHSLPEWNIVHAGLFDVEPEKEDPYVMLWTRFNRDPGQYELDKNLVYGHTPDKKGVYIEDRPQDVTIYGIDTGCGKKGSLTGFCLETRKSITV